ncbi:MAG: ABC transporter ATP-binding protein [Eubacteriales bacterium]|nr:ABC transporter ATP-binding protein [Eubacteriales bacterium]
MAQLGNRFIELENITKVFTDDDTVALEEINLYIRSKEFLTLLGPSGCGKTTMLRLIAGFEYPTRGRVMMDGKDITDLPAYKRRVNTVFQRYALFPHLNVFDNVAFGLKIKKMDNATVQKKVGAILEMVGLAGYGRRSIDALSGGQQQRIAIARALVNEPEVLLLDEPLGALDLKLRKEMQHELKSMQQDLGITFLYVTHDQEEALTMSDTIVVMNKGHIQQIGTPIDIYNEPKNAFVADFIGESNILPGIMHEDRKVEFSGRVFDCVDEGFAPHEPVEVVVRPEDIYVVDETHGAVTGEVESIIFKGVHYEIMVDAGDHKWMIHDTAPQTPGTRVGLIVRPEDIHVMHKREAGA